MTKTQLLLRILHANVNKVANNLLREADEPAPKTNDVPTPDEPSADVPVADDTDNDTGDNAASPEGDTETSDTDDGGDVGGGGIPSLVGGGGGGGGGAPFSDSGDGAEGSEETEEPEQETPKEPEDPIDALLKQATELAGTTNDVPQVLRVLKAGVQTTLTGKEQTAKLVNQLLTQKDNTLIDAGQRLDQFLRIQEGNMKITISEEKMQKIIAKLVSRKIEQLRENGELPRIVKKINSVTGNSGTDNSGDLNFDAIRRLGLKAQQTALDFETEIRRELDLEDPNKMAQPYQKAYKTAMDQFHAVLVAAVTDVVNSVKGLPKQQKEQT